MIATSSENQCNTILWFSEPLQSARRQTCEAKSFAVVYPVDRAINKEISSSHKLKPKLLPSYSFKSLQLPAHRHYSIRRY